MFCEIALHNGTLFTHTDHIVSVIVYKDCDKVEITIMGDDTYIVSKNTPGVPQLLACYRQQRLVTS